MKQFVKELFGVRLTELFQMLQNSILLIREPVNSEKSITYPNIVNVKHTLYPIPS